MSGGTPASEAAMPPGGRSEPPAPISTRAPAPRPRRLSRRAITLFAGGSAVGLATALTFALSSSSHHATPKQEVAVVHHQSADVLSKAPNDYGALQQQRAASMMPPSNAPTPPAATPTQTAVSPLGSESGRSASSDGGTAELQQRRQERDSARSSKLFAAAGEPGRAPQPDGASATPPSALQFNTSEAPPSTGTSDAQDRKAAFVAVSASTTTINSGRLAAPASRYVVMAGSTIAAALITGLSSDLPGEVVAQVTEDVFDSTTGRTTLIPQGSRLIGSYDAHVTYGQARALVVWTRLILPDGRSLELDRLIGTDAGGQSGFSDRVNRHTGKLLDAGLLSTLFGVGSGVASGSGGGGNDIAFAIRDSAGQSVERAGDKLVEHQLDVQPTITIRPGARVRVLVSRDLVLEPWPEDRR